jgi:hypothetical protein
VQAPVTPQWSNTNGLDKSQYITPSGSPLRLTALANANTGSHNNIRNTIGVTGKRQFEVTLTTTNTTTVEIWIDDRSTTLGPAVFPNVGGASTTPNGCKLGMKVGDSGTGTTIDANGVMKQSSNVANGTFLQGDIISVEFDTDAQTCSFYRTRAGVTVQIGTTVTGLTWMTGSVYAGIAIFNTGTTLDANFGTAAFARAVSAGYEAYNA